MKALIFDLDGTIIDTEKVNFESFKQTFAQYGCTLTLDMWRQYVGSVNIPAKICHDVAKQIGRPLHVDTIVRESDIIFNELIKKEQALPGVIDMLEAGKKAGLHIGLATNANHKWAMRHLYNLHIREYFDNVFTVDDVQHPKPHPEIYIKSVHHFNVDPKEAIAFEDSIVGSKAAAAAKLQTIAIPSELMTEENFNHVDLTLTSMADLSLEQLIYYFKLSNFQKNIS